MKYLCIIDALRVLCAQLTRDLLAIAEFLFIHVVRDEACQYGCEAIELSLDDIQLHSNFGETCHLSTVPQSHV